MRGGCGGLRGERDEFDEGDEGHGDQADSESDALDFDVWFDEDVAAYEAPL